MNLARYFSESLVKLEMDTVIEPLEDGASETKHQLRTKQAILDELVTMLDDNGRVGNRNKLLIDYVNREKKATTGIGNGIAIPHVRSMQAKEFMIGFARSEQGYQFESPDGERSHLFFVMAAPPYEDQLYLKAFKSLAEKLQYESVREELMEVTSPGEVIRIFRNI